MDVDLDRQDPLPPIGENRSARHLPWLVKKGYVKDAATANRLLTALAVVFLLLTGVVVYTTLQTSEATEAKTMRAIVQ